MTGSSADTAELPRVEVTAQPRRVARSSGVTRPRRAPYPRSAPYPHSAAPSSGGPGIGPRGAGGVGSQPPPVVLHRSRLALRAERELARRQQRRSALVGILLLAGALLSTVAVLALVH